MRRIILLMIGLIFLLGVVPGYGAEKRPEKNPIPKAKTITEAKSLATTYQALIIGNNQYKYLPKLKTARNDAVEVEKILKEKFGFQTEILLDATRANILGKINEIRKKLGEKDSLLIYYAGHGEYDKTVDKSYWLPIDAHRDDPTNWIMADDITSNIKRIAARHILVVSDSCYSGTLSRQAVTEMMATGERDGYLKKMEERPSRTLMASGGNEPVSDSGGGNNSVFAAAFLKAMKESEKAQFTAEEIFHSRIKAIVAGKSDQVPEYTSIRNSGDEGGDFVFKLARLDVDPIKPAEPIKVLSREETDQIEKERRKLAEERTRLEADRKRLEEQILLEKERAKVAEEKVLWEAKKKEAEEQSKRQQETQQKLADEKTRQEMERKKLEEERKSEEEKRGKLEEEKKRIDGKKITKPALSPPLSELLSLIPEYTISQPAPTDPPVVKEFLGIWTGKWDGFRDCILVIRSIDVDKKIAQVILAWGSSLPQWKIQMKKGYRASTAEFVPGEKPIIKWEGRNESDSGEKPITKWGGRNESDSAQLEFVLKKGKLEGSARHQSFTSRITMTKAQ